MKKVKKITKRAHSKVKRSAPSRKYPTHVYGIEHEFIIIVGGGFLVIVFAILLFLH